MGISGFFLLVMKLKIEIENCPGSIPARQHTIQFNSIQKNFISL
jgi:hypothetical protein